MKDSKLILMVLLSAALVGTWVYHLYDKAYYSSQRKEIFIKDSLAVAQGVEDSLHRIYSLTINSLDAKLDSSINTEGLLKGELNEKLKEIYRLRSEIAAILKKTDAKKEDLELARRKTAELQTLVLDLQSKNSSIEEEKQQISAVLDKVNLQVKDLEGGMQQLTRENKMLSEKVSLASTFMSSEIKLSPVAVKNDKEQETTNTNKVSKFIISFTVLNNISDYNDAEVFVIITQPDGYVLKTDAWESSSALQTKNGEKKIYTRKIKFEYAKGEIKRLFFSLTPDEFQKGTYSLQLYHNGSLIGQTAKTLH